MKEDAVRTWVIFFGGVVAALVGVWALAHVLPESWSWLPTILFAGLVFVSGPGAMLVRRRRERVTRSAHEGSLEREVAEQAAAGMFGTTLVAMVGFGLYLVARGDFLSGAVLYLLILLVICAYWVRYTLIRRQMT